MVRSINFPAADDPFPLSTAQACEQLGLSRQTLWQWVKLDVLKPGEHFIKRAPGVKSPMWWNIAAVREAIRLYNVNRVETYEGLT